MSEIEDELRRQLQALRVTHEPAEAARMTAVAVTHTASTGHRSWIAPLSAAAAVVALGGGVVVFAVSGGDGPKPAGHGPVHHGRYVPCSTDGPVSSTPPPPPTHTGSATPPTSGAAASMSPPTTAAAPTPDAVMPTAYTDDATPSRTEADCRYDAGTASDEPPPVTKPPLTNEPSTTSEPSRTSSLDASSPGEGLRTDVYGTAPRSTLAPPTRSPALEIRTDTPAGTSSTVYGHRVPAGKKLQIGAVRLHNPHSDIGTVTLRIAGSASSPHASFLTEALDGRDFIADLDGSLVIPAGSAVQVDVTCANATDRCTPSIGLDARLVPAG
jgi:hypothetical protein